MPTANNVVAELVGKFKLGLITCTFSPIYVALRLRGRRHEFLVVRLLFVIVSSRSQDCGCTHRVTSQMSCTDGSRWQPLRPPCLGATSSLAQRLMWAQLVGGSLISVRRCADTTNALLLSVVPFSLDVTTLRPQGLNWYTTGSPLGSRSRHGWLRGLERHEGRQHQAS